MQQIGNSLGPAAAPIELPDGSVVVPPQLAGAVRRILVRDLGKHMRTDGGAPTVAVRELLYALARAEHHFDENQAAETPVPAPVPTSTQPAPWVRVIDAAGLLGCGTSYIRRLCRAGRLVGQRCGPLWLIDRTSLDAYRHGAR